MAGRGPLSAPVFGATARIPLRALGYVTSAAAIGRYLPNAQIQFVHTLHTAARVNGADFEAAHRAASDFAGYGRTLLQAVAPDVAERVTFLTDPPEPVNVSSEAIIAATATLPDAVQTRLRTAGERRGADAIAYIAAHLQMHDTVVQLPTLTLDDVPAAPPEQALISLGAQSERPFYLARMACREQQVEIPGRVTSTAQLFTRHVLPPYITCHEGGEPDLAAMTLADPFRNPLTQSTGQFPEPHSNPSVARDINYLHTVMLQGAPTYA